MKFKIGDTVRIIKPKNIDYNVTYSDSTSIMKVCWVENMDTFINNEFKLLSYVPDEGWVYTDQSISWTFLEDWLELVSTEKKSNISAYDYAMSIVD